MDQQQPTDDVFEQILNKPEFIVQCKKAGIEDEQQVEQYWIQYSSAFQTSMLLAIYESLPETQQNQLKQGLDMNSIDGLQELLAKIDTGLLDKTLQVEIQPIFEKVVEDWKAKTELLVQELKTRNGEK